MIKKVKKQVEISLKNIEQILQDKGVQGIIEPLWQSVDIYQDYKTYQNDLAKFTPEQRNVFAMEWYFAEVCNGGHYQFFTNSTGIVWQEALAGFEMIDFTVGKEILEQFKTIFGGNIPFDRNEREDYMDNLSEEELEVCDKMDDLFSENEPFYNDLVEDFVRNNKEKFVFVGEIEVPETFL